MSHRLKQAILARRQPPSVRRRRQAKARPEVLGLERRELQRVIAFDAMAEPRYLPPSGRTVPVVVKGQFTIDNPQTPELRYQVVDQYRLVQPGRKVPITALGNNQYSFEFPVPLQAKINGSGPRWYYISVAAKTPQGSSGEVVPVLVTPQATPPLPTTSPATPRGPLARGR